MGIASNHVRPIVNLISTLLSQLGMSPTWRERAIRNSSELFKRWMPLATVSDKSLSSGQRTRVFFFVLFCFLSTLTHTSQRFVWDSVIYFSTTGAREDTLNLAHFHQNKIQLVCETISGYFEVFARNCLLSTLHHIVMQMRSTLEYIVVNCRGSFYSSVSQLQFLQLFFG